MKIIKKPKDFKLKNFFEQKAKAIEETIQNVLENPNISEKIKEKVKNMMKKISTEDIARKFLMPEGSTQKTQMPKEQLDIKTEVPKKTDTQKQSEFKPKSICSNV